MLQKLQRATAKDKAAMQEYIDSYNELAEMQAEYEGMKHLYSLHKASDQYVMRVIAMYWGWEDPKEWNGLIAYIDTAGGFYKCSHCGEISVIDDDDFTCFKCLK